MLKTFADINAVIEETIDYVYITTACTSPHLPVSLWIDFYGIWHISIFPEEGHY